MKKQFLRISILCLLIAGFMVSCKKDDTTAPVIVLIGDNPFNVVLLTTYSDPGATATDDEDGDISSRITTDVSGINTNLPGTYKAYYSVSDAAGNTASAERTVNVYVTTGALARTYSVVDSCGSGASLLVFNYAQTITSVNSTTIKFNKFADYVNNNNITATVNADGSITIPLQQATNIGSANENHTFQGSGYVTATGIYIEYTDTNQSQGNATANCRARFTR